MKMAKTMISFLLAMSMIGACAACSSKEGKETDLSKISSESVENVSKDTKSTEEAVASASDMESVAVSESDSKESDVEVKPSKDDEKPSEKDTEEKPSSDPADDEKADAYIGQYPYTVEIMWKGCKPDDKPMTPEFTMYDKDGNELATQAAVLSENADANGGNVYLGLPKADGTDYYLYIANVDLDTASSLPFTQATANIYDEDGKLLKTLDVGEWSYNRGQTGFWFYGVTWFTDDGLVGIDDYAA